MWSYVGEVAHEEFLLGKSIQGARVYLYPHLHFSLGFNNDQIVAVNVTTDPKRRIDITEPVVGQEVWAYLYHFYRHRLSFLILSSGFTNHGSPTRIE